MERKLTVLEGVVCGTNIGVGETMLALVNGVGDKLEDADVYFWGNIMLGFLLILAILRLFLSSQPVIILCGKYLHVIPNTRRGLRAALL
jgi:hypothetical protein